MTQAAIPWRERPLTVALETLRERPEAVVELADASIAAHVPAWRGYAEWDPSRLSGQARALAAQAQAGVVPGVLHGLPVSVKDNIGLAGWTLRAGSQALLPAPWQRDAAVVARLRRAGVLFTGVTHSVPFAFTSLGVTSSGEGPCNPWDPSRVCGGSSSGAAVSIAEGSAGLALGSDTAGSIRVPASMTGGVGLKLTHGRWPAAGMVPLSHSLDSWGVMGRSVADLVTVWTALEDERLVASDMPTLRSLRLGVLRSHPRESADAGIDTAFERALRELEMAGARVVDIDVPEAGEADALFRSGGLVAAELETFLALRLPAWRTQLEPPLDEAMARARTLPAARYRERLAAFQRTSRRATGRLAEAGVDALVLPTTPLTPPRCSAIASPATYAAADERILRHTAFVNYLQWCALSLPVGRDAAGLPVGLQLAVPGFAEARLLRMALAIERCLGTAHARLGTPPRPDEPRTTIL